MSRPPAGKLRLGLNIDHVATLRNARQRDLNAAPDIRRAADAAVAGGADSITFHLREDRRHIMDADAAALIRHLQRRGVPVNLEMAATVEMLAIALRLQPQAACIVPEKRREVTTEGGLDVVKGGMKLARLVNNLAATGIRVSLFITPDLIQVAASYATGAAAIELHTGSYCAATGAQRRKELRRLQAAAKEAHKLGLEVHAGHGLNCQNVAPVAAIREITELNIGHAVICEALFMGLTPATRQLRRVMTAARKG